MRITIPKIPYWPLLFTPTFMFCIGYLMNAAVVAANHGQMPVLYPGGCPDSATAAADTLHTCMDAATRLRPLADWLFVVTGKGMSMFSPGDFFIEASRSIEAFSLSIWAALMIKDSQGDKNAKRS